MASDHKAQAAPVSTVIGPASAGKTCFLVTLNQAIHRLHEWQSKAANGDEAAKAMLKAKRLPVAALRIEGRNDAMRESQLTREMILLHGWAETGAHQVEATSEVATIEFEIAWKSLRENRFPFRILDGPGGSLFPQLGKTQDRESDHYFRHRRALRDALENTTALMICLDGSDHEAAAEIAKGLRNLATELGERKHANIQRAIICLTKADKRYYNAGRNARGCADRSDPWDLATKLLSADGVAALQSIVKPGNVYARWISSYGFLPDGSANFDPATGGFLADDLEPSDAARFWEPYGVLESFMFLADGQPRDAFRLGRHA